MLRRCWKMQTRPPYSMAAFALRGLRLDSCGLLTDGPFERKVIMDRDNLALRGLVGVPPPSAVDEQKAMSGPRRAPIRGLEQDTVPCDTSSEAPPRKERKCTAAGSER